MLFQKKVNRALDKLHKESEAARQDMDLQEEGIPLEKNDFLAMVISAFLVFLPTALLVLGGIALIGYLFLKKKKKVLLSWRILFGEFLFLSLN